MGEKMTPCAECGMPCEPGEYHPYAACLMFRGCHNSTTVRANLTQPAQAVDVAERIRAKLPTIRASTGNPLFDAGTHDACKKIEALLAALPNANGKEDTPDAAR